MTHAVHHNVIRLCPSYDDLREQQKSQAVGFLGNFSESGVQVSVTASHLLQVPLSSSIQCLDTSCDKGEGSSSRSRQGSMFSELSSTSVSSDHSGVSGSSSSSSLFNDGKRSNCRNSPNLPDDLFQVRGAKVYADAYERLKKEAQHSSICQEAMTTDEEERWRSQLREVGVPNFEAVMMVHRLKTYLTVPQERSPGRERPPPPPRPKQNLHHVFTKLRSLLPNQNTIAGSSADIKGKGVDRSPHAFSSSPLYWLADEDVDLLIKDHETEWEMERLRVEEEKARSGFSYDEVANPSWEQGWSEPMNLEDVNDSRNHVFGTPLLQIQKYASLNISIGGYQHNLPLIVYLCVEQLYRTGLMFDLLFRAPPDPDKLDELMKDFDTGPEFMPNRKGRQKLEHESIEDIGALLRRYIDALPHSVMNPAIYEGFRCWCVNPSVEIDELRRIEIAKLLFKSMPAAHNALLSYLCAFFSQIPLSSDCNNLDIHSIARIFAVPLLKHTTDPYEKDEVCFTMIWILDRWGKISEGLFDIEEEATPKLPVGAPEEEDTHAPIQTTSTSDSSSSSNPSSDENSMYFSDDSANFVSDGNEGSMTLLEINDFDAAYPCLSSIYEDKFTGDNKNGEKDWKDYLLEERRKISCWT